MDRGKNIRKRERVRAQLIHELFTAMEPRLKDASIADLHAEMRRRYIRRTWGFSLNTCYRIFARWRAKPSPETILRRWKPGNRPIEPGAVQSVIAIALKQRVSLYTAHKIVSPPVSYPTILRRASFKPELRKLIQIEQARRRLAKAEKNIVVKTGGLVA